MKNFLFIMTDTQSQDMVGAYGERRVETPNLDRLAKSGVAFTRGYTTCPLCTPARSSIFSGLHPQVNGAWANNMAPASNFPLMGTIFRNLGYKTAYTGKWHLDGTGYFGDGVAGGGFDQEWWYDGKCYAEDIGLERFQKYRRCQTTTDLKENGFEDEGSIWAHRVADRALDFLSKAGDQPFVLAVSFDEPHGPFVAPPEYWGRFPHADIPRRPNFAASLEGKPSLQQSAREYRSEAEWPLATKKLSKLYGCNSYVDQEIGRVLDALEGPLRRDTVVIYTSDHGDMRGSHGLSSKGPMMYDEITRVPFIIRAPGCASMRTDSLASHVDIIPTMLELAGQEPVECLQGKSLVPVLKDTGREVNGTVFLGFHRFALNHDGWGGFYPIRCAVTKRYKLSINLLDKDELYDLQNDPYEMKNLIDDPGFASERDWLHQEILNEMERIRDPFRNIGWENRYWSAWKSEWAYHGGQRRYRPKVFPFQAPCIDADGTICGS